MFKLLPFLRILDFYLLVLILNGNTILYRFYFVFREFCYYCSTFDPDPISDIDYVTPLCSQVTYEGLLHDTFGIDRGNQVLFIGCPSIHTLYINIANVQANYPLYMNLIKVRFVLHSFHNHLCFTHFIIICVEESNLIARQFHLDLS